MYKRKNLEVAWEKVKRNRGAGGVDGEDLAAFESSLNANLDRLHQGSVHLVRGPPISRRQKSFLREFDIKFSRGSN